MSVDKYKITRLINRKPIEISKMQTIEKDGGIVMNYHKTVITQIVEAQEKVEFECICAEIQKFIEENNIDICYVINKSELIDCLQEHQILKLEIADLEAKLAESNNKSYTLESYNNFVNNQCKKLIKENKQLKQQLAEKEELYSDALETVDLLFTNQAKIDYAVEQLEQLRHDIWTNQQVDGYTDMSVDLYDLNDTIDVRIMQIKDGK